MFRPQNNSTFTNIKQAEIYNIGNTKQNERNEMHLKKKIIIILWLLPWKSITITLPSFGNANTWVSQVFKKFSSSFNDVMLHCQKEKIKIKNDMFCVYIMFVFYIEKYYFLSSMHYFTASSVHLHSCTLFFFFFVLSAFDSKHKQALLGNEQNKLLHKAVHTTGI